MAACFESSRCRALSTLPHSFLFGLGEENEAMDIDQVDDSEETERLRHLQERWKYDMDDAPPISPEGPDEQNRDLVDVFVLLTCLLLWDRLHPPKNSQNGKMTKKTMGSTIRARERRKI